MNSLKEDFILAKAGNEEAVEAILKRFSSLIHKQSWRTTGKYDQDCYQECMLAIYLAISKFEIKE
ncbi:TPA: helix-turn-helix domain-containing protein [Enterococcus faecium]